MELGLVTWNPEPDGLPSRTLAHIYIGQYGEASSNHPDVKGRTVIGYQCASYGELEGLVELLKQDLEAILRKGRKAFANQNG